MVWLPWARRFRQKKINFTVNIPFYIVGRVHGGQVSFNDSFYTSDDFVLLKRFVNCTNLGWHINMFCIKVHFLRRVRANFVSVVTISFVDSKSNKGKCEKAMLGKVKHCIVNKNRQIFSQKAIWRIIHLFRMIEQAMHVLQREIGVNRPFSNVTHHTQTKFNQRFFSNEKLTIKPPKLAKPKTVFDIDITWNALRCQLLVHFQLEPGLLKTHLF